MNGATTTDVALAAELRQLVQDVCSRANRLEAMGWEVSIHINNIAYEDKTTWQARVVIRKEQSI